MFRISDEAVPDDSRPTVTDLFAGAGLFSYAFEAEGCRLIQAVEKDRVAAATHELNLPVRAVAGDVTNTKPVQKCDIVIAGPPCQGFSTLGKRDVDDPRNSLCFEVVRWVKLCEPSLVVIENVAAFLDTKFAAKLFRMMRGLHYTVTSGVLNAYDFGVAQDRQRAFVIASRLGKISLPTGTEPKMTVRSVLKDLPSKPNGVNFHYGLKPTDLAHARIKLIPPGGDKRDIMRAVPNLVPPSWWNTKCQVTDVYGRMDWDRPSNTLRTGFLNPSKGRYLHPEEDRVITLREAARIHSIPDSWKFVGKPYQIARQIGNSVPPNLGRAVARAVLGAF